MTGLATARLTDLLNKVLLIPVLRKQLSLTDRLCVDSRGDNVVTGGGKSKNEKETWCQESSVVSTNKGAKREKRTEKRKDR